MKATDEFEYLWQDNEQFKKPTKMPAPEYVEHLMSWVQANVDNEQMFPSRIGTTSSTLSRHLLICDNRRTLPTYLPSSYPTNLQASLSRICTHLLPPLSRRHQSWPRASSQHKLQALRVVCTRIRTSRRQPRLLGPARRSGGKHAKKRLIHEDD